jgi:ketosteroid isomerase-like protein
MATTAQQANVERIRRTYEAFAKGDMDSIRNQMAGDVVFHILGQTPLSRDYKGQEDVFGFFGQLMERSGGTFHVEVHDILANDEHGTALVTEFAERNGKKWESRAVHVTHFDATGKTREFWAFQEDQAKADTFWE